MGGHTGLVLLMPVTDRVVERWRQRYDPVASFGMPAHVTVVYPWKPAVDITAADHAALRRLSGSLPGIEVTFERFGRFERTLWLDPQPAGPIVDLVERVVTEWPEYPPFAGAFARVVPHLTLADGRDPETLTDVVADVEARLPLRESTRHLSLMRFDAGRWEVAAEFPFAPRPASAG
jgi:2'-5' RNA ligase